MKAILFLLVISFSALGQNIPILMIDGQNNHDWRVTTPHLKKVLEETGWFKVEVATVPSKGGDMKSFRPVLKKYRAVVSNYNGQPWSKEFMADFEAFVESGGGFVSVHAADNSFPEWLAYNQMIAVGGWENRTEKHGPYLRLRDGKFRPLQAQGPGGSHGKQHEFVIETREPKHPIMLGLPAKWLHAKDELYDRLRGPATNVVVLASAYSSKESGGSGEHEPLLMAVAYGKGRIFHTALGHNGGDDYTSQKCVGFITTFQRGTEWVATGKVTQKVPTDFPTENKLSLRN